MVGVPDGVEQGCSLTTLLPDTKFFLYLYVQKEALLSSQIEGTQWSFSDLVLFENDAEPITNPCTRKSAPFRSN